MEGISRLPAEYQLPAIFLQRLRQTIHDENRRAKPHVIHAIPTGSSRARIHQLTDIKRIARGRRHPPELPMPRIVAANLIENSLERILAHSQDFRKELVHAALHYGLPMYFQSWNCGHSMENQGDHPYFKHPQLNKYIPSCKDPCKTGFHSVFGPSSVRLLNLMSEPQFNSPSCIRK